MSLEIGSSRIEVIKCECKAVEHHFDGWMHWWLMIGTSKLGVVTIRTT